MYDIIIIGAGPAGLTSAIYARRAAKKVLVFEALSYGGQIINSMKIDNYPAAAHISGFDFATNLYNQVKELDTEIKYEKVINIVDKKMYKEVITTMNTYQAKTIILATGRDNRKLGVANEDKLIGRGVSYCATCDGRFYKDKVVCVVGGGNTALEDCDYLANIVSKVYIINKRDTFNDDNGLLNKLMKKDNVEFIYNSSITSLNGNDKLESIEIVRNNLKQKLDVDAVFIAIGKVPENENFRDLIKMDEIGYVIASEDCHTNIDGIYVAGDNRTKLLRQLVTATADGAVAAMEAIKYISKNNL